MATVVGTNYTKRKKDVLVITVGTEEEPVTLSILPPTKKIHDQLINVADFVDAAGKGELDENTFSLFECLEFVAEAMSHNREGRIITPDYLNQMEFDVSDVSDFIGLYFYFITRLVEGKN